MNPEDILSGQAGLAGIQWALNAPASRRALKKAAQGMLRPGFRAGTFHLTRAKFKPGRKLSAYFNFPALDGTGETSHPVQLAVAWKKDLDGSKPVDGWAQLQEEADRSGLMPVHSALWSELPDQGMELRVWPFDPKFPQLVRLGNPSFAAGLFDSLGIGRERKQPPVITPIRYRPGERHVLRYEIDSPEADTEGGGRVYAKLYSNAEDAARAFGIANRVVDWLDSNPMGLQGNRPTAMSQENGVIFYPHAPGVPLSHQLNRSRKWLGAQLQTIGRGLALLR